MNGAAIGEILLRQVPEHLVAGVHAGEFAIHGSIIRSLATGQIVAHLQETSGLAQAAGALLSIPGSLPLQVASLGIDAIGHTVGAVQMQRVMTAVEALQNLQLVNLAVGAIGIGVAVATGAVMVRKINRVEDSLSVLSDQFAALSKSIELLRHDRIAEDFTRLKTAIERLNEGWHLADPLSEWREAARDAHAIGNTFERRAQELNDVSSNDALAGEPFLEAFALATATRVSARLAAGDDAAAREAAANGAERLVKLGSPARLDAIVLQRIRDAQIPPATNEWQQELDRVASECRPIVVGIRKREEAAISTSLTLSELESRGIRGREWLEVARAEEKYPLICLPVGEAR